MGQTRGTILQGGKWLNNAQKPIVKQEAHGTGGHQNHCTEMYSVAENRRVNASDFAIARLNRRDVLQGEPEKGVQSQRSIAIASDFAIATENRNLLAKTSLAITWGRVDIRNRSAISVHSDTDPFAAASHQTCFEVQPSQPSPPCSRATLH